MTAPRTVSVYLGETFRRECGGCGAPLTFYKTVARERWMPFTGDPVPLRTRHEFPDRPGNKGRLIGEIESSAEHHVSCPRAGDFRRPR